MSTEKMTRASSLSIAVLLPCRNEEATIGTVVQAFRRAVPDAVIYVYDNKSSDRTAQVAMKAGAIVRWEPLVGKGNVVRRMFANVDADVYVIADGDATYDAGSAPAMIDLLVTHDLDMVVGIRRSEEAAAYRHGHRTGNKLLTGAVSWIFGRGFSDMLSGYRVLSRRYVKTFPAEASGFEIETELTIHSLQMRLPTAEYPVLYSPRPPGSTSKLRSVRDALRILATIAILIKEERPFLFFSTLSELFVVISVVLGYPIFVTYIATGLVPRLPTAVLAMGIVILAFLSFTCGIILDSVSRGRRESKQLLYLALPSVGSGREITDRLVTGRDP
jgi:glycosyltransferase involved in cell wall biosynthesis